MEKDYKSFRPKFYQAVLQLRTHTDIMKLTKGQSLTERLGSEKGECPECGCNHWIILPKESLAIREGGKPYIECLGCGYLTHL
jgi:hypothetical protein